MSLVHLYLVSRLEYALEHYGRQPEYWAQDVLGLIENLRQAVRHPHFAVASDLVQAFGVDAARAAAPRLIYRFGELLYNWTLIRKAAFELQLACARTIS
jgi:hypothetical protein